MPDLKKIMYYKGKLITYSKICLHEPEDRITENAHIDWSGFTTILHNDEKFKHHLNIASHKECNEDLEYRVYKKHIETYKNNKYTKAIIFPGQALKKSKININPTPHYVAKISATRHSIITFCMVPGVECSFSPP